MPADSFGIDPARVYANDDDVNLAFWTVLKGGTHGRIVKVLSNDAAVTTAIHAKLLSPGDPNARLHVVDIINRETADCLGQAILGQTLRPDDSSLSIYHILKGGTAADLDAIINAAANTDLHNAFANKDAAKIIHFISRQTGRGLFQASEGAFIQLLTNPLNAVSILKDELKKVLPPEVGDAIP